MTHIAQNTEDTDKIGYCLKKINEASKHLLKLINDILDMSKIEANKIEIKEGVFVLFDMIKHINDIVAVNAEEKNHELTTQIDENIPKKLIGDELRLVQVITNFLSNAIKFTPEGGKIKINVTLDSRTKKDGYTIKFEVIDNGIGLNPEHYEKIFSSFEQADGSIDRQYGGTGLGLSISKNIIELMGGSVGVESAKGGGSCFYFYVTLHTPDPFAATEPENSGEVCTPDTLDSFSGKVILIVDDIEINREIVTAMLDATSITFDHAENGKQAVEKFKNAPEKYDLIFMDVQMPLMDGLEATRKIRVLGTMKAKKIPIIAMTANALSHDIESCKAAGMNDHIGKPLNFDEVCKKLRIYLQ
jgi:CheY-like chemotaxis protein